MLASPIPTTTGTAPAQRRHNPYQQFAKEPLSGTVVPVPCFVSQDDVKECCALLTNPWHVPHDGVPNVPEGSSDLYTLDKVKQLCHVARTMKYPPPFVRLFLGQLHTRNIGRIRDALNHVLYPRFGCEVVYVVDVLKEGRKGNCAKIVVHPTHAGAIVKLLNHRLTIVDQVYNYDLLDFGVGPGYNCITCEFERTQL